MDTKALTESDYVTIGFLSESPSKRLRILSAGALKPNQEGMMKLNVLVEIDGKQKNYSPNRTTLRAMQAAWGFESQAYVAKELTLAVGKVNGKDAVLGTPVLGPLEMKA